jgi:ATP-dependent exoDNAse (exonuclease V) beta subunit
MPPLTPTAEQQAVVDANAGGCKPAAAPGVQAELRPEEANVAYVAVTRARLHLGLNGYDRTPWECLRLVGAPADTLERAE